MASGRAILIFGVVAAAVPAHATFTLFTFSDPAPNSSAPLFLYDFANPGARTLDGGWGTAGFTPSGTLTLVNRQNNLSYTARYELVGTTGPGLTVTGTGSRLTTGGGSVIFTDAANPSNVLVRYDFTAGSFSNRQGSGGRLSALITGYSGSLLTGSPYIPEQFSFSFTNWAGTATSDSYTAAFTSSAVPEPATVGALVIGLAALAARRRKANRV